MINHFIGESFSYNDIETTDDPNVLYRLNVKDQYLISAVSIANDDIKLIITDQEGHPVNINGDLLPYEEPYVATTVSGYITNRDDVIRSQMLKIADDLLYNITEEVSKMPDKKYLNVDELMKSDPFDRGWSTNPYDAVETLRELGYNDVDIQGDYITFSDNSDSEYYFYINRVGHNTYQYVWGGSSTPSDDDHDDEDSYDVDDEEDSYDDDEDIYDSEDPMRAYLRSYYARRYSEPETEDDIEDEIPSPALPYDSDDDEYEDADELLKDAVEEDTVKKSNGKWTNKGKQGEHGEFDTKKAADAQRKAMFANGYRG